MSYKRRTAGKRQKLSAGGWNAAMTAAEAHEEDLRSRLTPASGNLGLNRSYIYIRNTTGDARERGDILGIGDWTFDPDDGQQLEELQETLCVEGVAPEEGTHEDQFVVLPDDLADGEVGPAVLFGLVLVLVNISDEAHKFCTIRDADTRILKSASSGRGRILKAQEGTGNKWCLVELGRESTAKVFCVTNAAISQGGSGTVERLKRNDANTAWERSGETFTAYDIFLNTGESVEACFIVGVVPYDGLQVIDSIYCNANDWLEGCDA